MQLTNSASLYEYRRMEVLQCGMYAPFHLKIFGLAKMLSDIKLVGFENKLQTVISPTHRRCKFSKLLKTFFGRYVRAFEDKSLQQNM